MGFYLECILFRYMRCYTNPTHSLWLWILLIVMHWIVMYTNSIIQFTSLPIHIHTAFIEVAKYVPLGVRKKSSDATAKRTILFVWIFEKFPTISTLNRHHWVALKWPNWFVSVAVSVFRIVVIFDQQPARVELHRWWLGRRNECGDFKQRLRLYIINNIFNTIVENHGQCLFSTSCVARSNNAPYTKKHTHNFVTQRFVRWFGFFVVACARFVFHLILWFTLAQLHCDARLVN